ncbi:MAG: hypothetical protein WD159_01795 [Patescibacteria group bacterium]
MSRERTARIIKRVTIIILLATAVLFIGVYLFFYLLGRTIEDNSKDNSKIVLMESENALRDGRGEDLLMYSGSWNLIASERLGGFSSKVVIFSSKPTLVEKSTAPCQGTAAALKEQGQYLRVEGVLCGTGYWLEDSKGREIRSLEELKARFGPVETEEEAGSFVVSTQEDLKIDEDGFPEGHALPVNGGFLVQLIRKNTFGCGPHALTRIIFEVTGGGEVRKIAEDAVKSTGGPETCVD